MSAYLVDELAKALSMRLQVAAIVVSSAAVVNGCRSEGDSVRDRYDLYVERPDRAAERGVSLMDSEDQVAESLGRPTMSVEQEVSGQRWTRWSYAEVVEAWEPYEDPGASAFPASRRPARALREDLRLTFVDGRLRVIENRATGRMESNLVGEGERRGLREFEGE